MKRFSSILMTACAAVAVFAGCSVTEEKKVKVITINEVEEMKLTRVSVKGTLRDSDGNPVSGVTVRAVTLHDNDASITTRDGRFTIFTRYAPGEAVDFQFSGPQVSFVESVSSMPTGIDPIGLHFTLMPDASVHFAAYEY